MCLPSPLPLFFFSWFLCHGQRCQDRKPLTSTLVGEDAHLEEEAERMCEELGKDVEMCGDLVKARQYSIIASLNYRVHIIVLWNSEMTIFFF